MSLSRWSSSRVFSNLAISSRIWVRSVFSCVIVYTVWFWGGCVLEGFSSFVGYPKGQSVIEEKGEGFENGKIVVGAFGVAFNLKVALHHIIRLKI